MTEEPELRRTPYPDQLLLVLFERIAEKPLIERPLSKKTPVKTLHFKKALDKQ